jgi:choline kinase
VSGSKIVRNAVKAKDDARSHYHSVIIVAAGEGSRIKSRGPRSLLSVGSRNLIEHQVELIKERFTNSTIILVTGFDATNVMNRVPSGTICVENERYGETNVMRSIGIGLRAAMADRVLIIYGDLVFNKELLDFPVSKSCTLFENSNTTETEVGCTVDNDVLENMFYGLSKKWVPVMYFVNKELKLLKNLAFDKQREKLYGFEAINHIMGKGGEFAAYSPKNSIAFDIDTPKDMERAKEFKC